MPKFFANTSRGLISVLEKEMQDLGLKVLGRETTGIAFDGPWEDCYKANLHLRTANRVLKPLLDFPAYQLEDLYHNTLKHDFTKYIGPHQTFAVDGVVRESKIRDQRMFVLKIKDAIADQFRKRYGERPNVDSRQPDLNIMARLSNNQVSLALDTSGESLNQRGYRLKRGRAPLRETVAAGLLKLANWRPGIPLYDPMCGSGTILIEAALMSRNVAPGTLRKRFAFQNLEGFKDDVWQRLVTEALDAEVELPEDQVLFFGSDMDKDALSSTRANLEEVDLRELIKVARRDVQEIVPPLGMPEGWVITNPPYGERLGITDDLFDVYKNLAHQMKTHFSGWDLWVLSGNEKLTGALKMKAAHSFPVFNGNIDCRFLHYPIRK